MKNGSFESEKIGSPNRLDFGINYYFCLANLKFVFFSEGNKISLLINKMIFDRKLNFNDLVKQACCYYALKGSL